MNVRDIQNELFRMRAGQCSVLLPNYTPEGWFEADVFAVSKAGYFTEYEIKLTAADFLADFGKRKSGGYAKDGAGWRRTFGEPKHALLGRGDVSGPVHFWFVMPDGLVDPAKIPLWAGLMTVTPRRGGVAVRDVRKSPRLHNEPVAGKITAHAFRVCYWRFWQERMRGK